jgi:hypothetical protein
MNQNRRRGGNYGPYCCLLFLLGLGFLIAGVGSGMVMNAISSLTSNAPDSSESLKTLGIWSAFTFGSLGLGSLGIFYYGIRTSIQWFGAILILCGVVGLVVQYTGGGTSNSGNVIWVVMNFIAQATGSLAITSYVSIGIGLLLVFITLLFGGSQGSSQSSAARPTSGGIVSQPSQSARRGQLITCSHCGHSNPTWYAVCEKCGGQITLGKNNLY